MVLLKLAVVLASQGIAPLDVRVDGLGLLRFLKDGRAVYAKGAKLLVKGGRLCHEEGNEVLPAVHVPAGVTGLAAGLDGTIYGLRLGGKSPLGQLVLAKFDRQAGLTEQDGFIVARERPQLGVPGDDDFGVIRDSRPAAVEVPKKAVVPPVASSGKAPQVIAAYRPQSTVAGPTVITVKAFAESNLERFILGEIADISGPDALKIALSKVQIGDSPVAGVVRGIDAGTIYASLARAGYPKGTYQLNMPTAARLKRSCQEVTDETFVQQACHAVSEQLQVKAQLKNEVPQPAMSVPVGDLKFKVESCNRVGKGFAVSLGVFVDGKRVNARLVQLSPDAQAVSVGKGQSVRITVKLSGAVVETTGKAKDLAYLGQEISVETESGALLKGVVVGPNQVEVNL